MIIAILIFVWSVYNMMCVILALTGMLKGPVLATFEKYGDKEPYFFPLPRLLMWLGLAVVSGGFLINEWFGVQFALTGTLGVVVLLLSWLTSHYNDIVRNYAEKLPTLPLWYGRLCDETTRRERRRLAYMWLRLPVRTRLLYNASDRAFFLWADLVIAATVREV
jgi:hypothetical protein